MGDGERRVSDRLQELMTEVRAERARAAEARGSAGDERVPENRGSGSGGAAAGAGRRAAAWRWARRGLLVALAVLAPFLVLLRTATWLYGAGFLGTWLAMAAGAALSFAVLAVYVLVVARWVRQRWGGGSSAVSAHPVGGIPAKAAPARRTKRLLQGVAIVVVAYCAYGLVFLSAGNAKTDAVRAEYRSLHPMLRMAVGTLVLVDSDLLVTDAARDLEDYAAMGLPPNEASLHLTQADGYAHALDLRTAGRPGWVNGLVRAWFAATGFRTLRHVGTADHLHVSLPLPEAG